MSPEPARTARQIIAAFDGSELPPTSTESRSWDDALDFLNLVMTARDDPREAGKITPTMLAELAAEIQGEADKMDGPMPPEVEAFIRQFGPPS